MGQVDYKQLFSTLECNMIIFFEDDFVISKAAIKKSQLAYRLSRMDVDSRKKLFEELSKKYNNIAIPLIKFSNCMDGVFDTVKSWNDDVIIDDMESALDVLKENENYQVIRDLYDAINPIIDKDIKEILLKYGVSVNHPEYFNEIFANYIFAENRWKPFRIYTSFNSEQNASFDKNLTDFYKANQTDVECLCCIIDDELSGEKKANAIIEEIVSFNKSGRKSIVGAVVTSQGKSERVDKEVFFEYVAKNQIDKKLQPALLKSTYNYAISKLKSEIEQSVSNAFSEATANRNIAFYLSHLAVDEGITNYQIIKTWINTLCDYELLNSKPMRYIVGLTNLINQIEVENEENEISEDLKKLNTFEAFDYNVNVFFQAPAPGDIFMDNNDDIYILMGQECDSMISPTRKKKLAVSELIPAKRLPQQDLLKIKNNLKYVMINNFKMKADDANTYCLRIDYTQKKFLDTEVVDLCSYNLQGKCKINLKQPLDDEIKKIMLEHLVDRFCKLQEYFASVKILCENYRKELDIVLGEDYVPRLFKTFNVSFQSGDLMNYPLKRICRLKENYTLYLYKLYLEHMGRLPFNSINLAKLNTISVSVVRTSQNIAYIDVYVILSAVRNKNIVSKALWKVDVDDLNDVLQKLELDLQAVCKEQYIELTGGEQYINLVGDNRLKINVNKKNRVITITG